MIRVSIESISGVSSACAYRSERSVLGVAWQHGPRPRPDALLTLDPTQRPSAPLRWA